MNYFLVNSSSLKIKLAFRVRYEKFSEVHLVLRYFIKLHVSLSIGLINGSALLL